MQASPEQIGHWDFRDDSTRFTGVYYAWRASQGLDANADTTLTDLHRGHLLRRSDH